MANPNDLLTDLNTDAIDWGEVDEVTLPDGVYPVIVEEVEVRQGPKAPYFAIQFRIKGHSSETDGMMLFTNITLSPNAFARVRSKQTLTAILGKEPGRMTVGEMTSLLFGCACRAVVQAEEFEGTMRPSVQDVLPAAQGVLDFDIAEPDVGDGPDLPF